MQLPALNKPQRAALLAAAAVVAVIQLMSFEDNGIDGMGWIVSVIVIAVFCVLALRSEPKTPAQVTRTESLGNADVERNLGAITRAADNIAARVRRKLPDADTSKGPLSSVTASMTRSPLLLYGFGLLTICKLKQDADYLGGEEYRRTRAAVMRAAARADNAILPEVSPGRLASPEHYAADLGEVEKGVASFVRAIAAGQVDAPAAQLNSWLDRRSSIPKILAPAMESVAREEMRLMYASLY